MTSPYAPLDKARRSIRLLHVSREPHHNRIHYTTSVEDLSTKLYYEALSYTWGEPDKFNFRIWVDGVLVPVRRNLLCALRALRVLGHDVLWIDALCINQRNVEERNHQVGMMGDIYRQAHQVLSWLGTPDVTELCSERLDVIAFDPVPEEVLAFDLLEQADMDRRGAWWREFDKALRHPRSKLARAFEQLERLFNAAYWSRLWIVQEVYLASQLRLFYGVRTAALETFLKFREEFETDNLQIEQRERRTSKRLAHPIINTSPWQLFGPQYAKARKVRKSGESLDASRDFLLMLLLTKDHICQDRRDKIYGILGLVGDDGASRQVSIDYSCSLYELCISSMSYVLGNGASYHLSPLGVSYVLQGSLLCPGAQQQDCPNLLLTKTTPRAGSTNPRMEIYVSSLGRIDFVSDAFDEFSDISDLTGYKSQDLSSTNKSGDWQQPWRFAMELLWASDRDLFTLFQSELNAMTGRNLAIFRVEGHFGIASKDVQKGDMVSMIDTRYMLSAEVMAKRCAL